MNFPFPTPQSSLLPTLGGFQTWQNMDNLIEAFEKIRDPNIRLLMVGFAKEDVAIKQEFAAKFGQRVKLVDKTDQASLVNMLRSVACFVIPRIKHPALSHAFPTKFIEYASLGRPTMVNDVDETADFVRKYRLRLRLRPIPGSYGKDDGAHREPSRQNSFRDGTRARRMAKENFSWQQIGDDYAELVRSVVARFRGEARL